jgi:hypothetical protein
MFSGIPPADSLFDEMFSNFMTYATANLANLGINPLSAEWTNLVTAKTDWDAKYAAHIAAQNAAAAAREGKDVSRANAEGLLRALIKILRANPAQVSPAELEALGLHVYDEIRTPAPVPTTRPVLKVDTSQRQRHTVSWSDESTPTSIRKPAGVHGMELWAKIGGDPPVNIAECIFVALDTRTPYTYDFEPEAFGQVVHWIGRWVNTRGEVGPISETESATVVA